MESADEPSDSDQEQRPRLESTDKRDEETVFVDSPQAADRDAGGESGAAPLEIISDYRLHREIARGGMGVIFEATHQTLRRKVALKMMAAGKLASDDEIRRFRREAEAAAALDHPGIVALYEVGEHEGRLFLTMPLIEGRDLGQVLQEGPLEPRRAAEIVRDIADASDYAHRRGIIHRDLKPSNIMIDGSDRTLVTDFGLAKRIGVDQGQTTTGQIVGTPGYMAPEQAAGRPQEISPRTDVYALGAILYALLSGRPPFQAENPVDTIIQLIEQPPVKLRLINPQIPADLEAISLKCLAKESADRYASASELMLDLDRFIAGDPISAKSHNWMERAVRTLNRRRHVSEMEAWSDILLWVAGIVFVAELAIMWHKREGPPYVWQQAAAIRGAQFLAMIAVVVAYRRQWAGTIGDARRQNLAVWVGFVLCCCVLLVVMNLTDGWRQPLQTLYIYPQFAAMSAFAFFVLGAMYWGKCYIMAILFLVSAPLMTQFIDWAPIWFGGLWSACLVTFAIRVRHAA